MAAIVWLPPAAISLTTMGGLVTCSMLGGLANKLDGR